MIKSDAQYSISYWAEKDNWVRQDNSLLMPYPSPYKIRSYNGNQLFYRELRSNTLFYYQFPKNLKSKCISVTKFKTHDKI